MRLDTLVPAAGCAQHTWRTRSFATVAGPSGQASLPSLCAPRSALCVPAHRWHTEPCTVSSRPQDCQGSGATVSDSAAVGLWRFPALSSSDGLGPREKESMSWPERSVGGSSRRAGGWSFTRSGGRVAGETGSEPSNRARSQASAPAAPMSGRIRAASAHEGKFRTRRIHGQALRSVD